MADSLVLLLKWSYIVRTLSAFLVYACPFAEWTRNLPFSPWGESLWLYSQGWTGLVTFWPTMWHFVICKRRKRSQETLLLHLSRSWNERLSRRGALALSYSQATARQQRPSWIAQARLSYQMAMGKALSKLLFHALMGQDNGWFLI